MGFLTRTQTTILSAAVILAIASGMNALLGVVKNYLLSANFGTSAELTVFFTADKVPSLIYSLLVVGTMSTVFIPVYSEAIKKKEDKANEVASLIINAGILFFVVLGSLAFIFAPQLLDVISAGQFTQEEIQLGTKIMRIMIAAQIGLVISSFLTSLLQSYNYFLLPSLAPILYNLGIIIGTVAFSKSHGIFGPVYGIILGTAAHLLIQLPSLRKIDFKYAANFNLGNPYVRKIFRLVPPRIFSVLIANLVGTINNALAILISKPSVIYLKFANQLQYFPISLFAVSIGSASLPSLSKAASAKSQEKFKRIFLTSLHQMLFLVVPISVILLVLRIPIIRLAYGSARFSWEATVKTAYTLAFYSLSIFAQSTSFLLTRSFYALRDTKTPVKVSVVTIILNVVISLFFVRSLNLGVWSIAFAYSLTSFIDMLALFFLLDRKLQGFEIRQVLIPFVKIGYAAAIMGVCLYIPLKVLDQYVFDTTRTIQLIFLTGITGIIGMTTYILLTKALKVKEVELLMKSLKKLKLKTFPKQNDDVKGVTEISN